MAAKTKNLSIIDNDLRVEGDLSSEGKLVIKGVVKGTIAGESIIIAEEGQVYSDMEVNDVTIGGVYEGNVKAKGKVVVLSSGKCTGTVTCNDLIVESGGIINAEITCTRDDGFVQGRQNSAKESSAKIKWLKKKPNEPSKKEEKEEKVL
ncbi:MAG: polymer-forming cytoskeletal protein [Desulforegulaceae bacterium]|nr:polymer-forming cytoskeletal protein [Desulforegulaceae bacterium]